MPIVSKTINGKTTEFNINFTKDDIKVGALLHEIYKSKKTGELEEAYFCVFDIYMGAFEGKEVKMFKLYNICNHEIIDTGIENFIYELPDDLFKPLEILVK